MKIHPRHLLATAGLLLTAFPPAIAAPAIEETVLGPVNAGGLYTLAPAGGHAAYMGRKDGRLFMLVDGVEGPQFDEIYKAAGGGAFFPEKAGVWPGTLGGIAGHDAPVLYSPDGRHYAYAGTQGKDYVVIHDGKEIGRGPWELMGRRGLTMSPGGGQVYWHEARMEQGRTVVRPMMTGKPGPWINGPVTPAFSADDTHYAYVGQPVGSDKLVLIVDGKDAGYAGQQPVFSADGSVLFTLGHEGGMTVLANGKTVVKGGVQVSKIVPAPVGRRYAVLARQMVQNKPVDFLYIDGKQVSGSEDAQEVWFSPDGKRYAALCHSPFGGPYAMLVDGKRGPDYARIDAAPPYWTADNSKVIFTGGNATASFISVEGVEAPYTNSLIGLSALNTAARGNHYAWGTLGQGNFNCTVSVDGKSILPPNVYPVSDSLTFSPDGSRFGYLFGPSGRNDVTGVVVDDVTQAGIAPAYFGRWVTTGTPAPATQYFAFSDDSKHVAFVGHTATGRTNGVYVDGKLVYPNARAVFFPGFTPDNHHLFWVADVLPQPPQPMLAVYLDGREVVRANGYFFQQLPGSWQMDDKGVVTFLAADGNVAKRYRITPSAETSLATMVADAEAAEAKALADAAAAKQAAEEAAAKKKADQAAAAAKAKADYDAAVAAKAKARQDALDAKAKAKKK